MEDQQHVTSRIHACGHARSTEAQVVQSDKEYQEGVNLPCWTNTLHIDQPGHQDDRLRDAAVGVREYQEYVESREVLFAMFPQLDTVVLEDIARKHASVRGFDLVEAMEKLSMIAERLEKELAAYDAPYSSSDQLPTPTSTPSTSASPPNPSTSTAKTDIMNNCKYFQVKVENNRIPESESSKPGLNLARYMLAEYDKADGPRYAEHFREALYNITVVQNRMLEARFRQCKNRLEKQEGGINLREFILYHGTEFENAFSIAENGFDKCRIKSEPKGFYLANWPEMPLQYGQVKNFTVLPAARGRNRRKIIPNGSVVLVCKVHLGHVRYDGMVFDAKLGRQRFDCDSLVQTHPQYGPQDAKDYPHKPVTKKVFIIPEPDQILPVGIFNYFPSGHSPRSIPWPDETFGHFPDCLLNCEVYPSRLDMTQVREAIQKLKPKEDSDYWRRKIKFFEDIVEAYEKRDLCVKCGLANSKTTSAALVEFLDWADLVFKKEERSFLKENINEEPQEASCYVQQDDFVGEIDLYDSEEKFDDKENDVDDAMSDNLSPAVE